MNKITYFILLIFVAISACAPNEKDSEYIKLEKALSDSPTNDEIAGLLEAYNKAIESESMSDEEKRSIYEKAYSFTKEHRISLAPGYLSSLLRETNSDDPEFPGNLFELAEILESQRKVEAANVIYSNILQQFPTFEKSGEIESKLNGLTSDQIIDTLMINRMKNPDKYGINTKVSFRFVDASEAYALSAPMNERTPALLFNAAEMAKLLRTNSKALALYDWLIEDYPDYERSPSALFIKAFVLENEIGNLELAREAYESFLEKYPDDDFADDAKFSLQNLGKSADEVLKIIESQNSDNQ